MEEIFGKRRNVIIPQDPAVKEIIAGIDRQCRTIVEKKFGVILDYEWHSYTITNVVIESVIRALSVDMSQSAAPRATLNFYDVFIARVSNKLNRRAEKEGNINISFEPGPKADDLIQADVDILKQEYDETVAPMEYFYITDPDMDPDTLKAMNMAYYDIDRHARFSLSNNYGIAIVEANAMFTFAIAETFILLVFRDLLYRLANSNGDDPVSLNLNDNIEFHAIKKGDGVVLTMNPGYNAKLLIKSDEATEAQEIDDSLPWLSEN